MIFIGACFPEKILDQLIEKNMIKDIPANVFGWKIVRSLSLNSVDITVVNEHKLPQKERKIIKRKEFIHEGIRFINYKYVNITLFRMISKAVAIFREIVRLKPKTIIVYSLHTPFLLPAVVYALLKRQVKIVQIVTDLPCFMSSNKNAIRNFLKRIDKRIQHMLIRRVDGWILLSELMKEAIGIEAQSYLVMEGICDDVIDTPEYIERKNYILYSGALISEYGLPQFIEAFIKSEIPCDLLFYGQGAYSETIMNISKRYPRIKYMGMVKREDLKKIQREALLLVNPRSSFDEYTKYSFPSKTMEYLESGTPVMMERLLGIPSEYFDYIIEVNHKDWAASLQEFYYSSSDHKESIGKSGRQFIISKKNMRYQGRILKQYIEGIDYEDHKVK